MEEKRRRQTLDKQQIVQRKEQLERWFESETYATTDTVDRPHAVQFQDACVFLEICMESDMDEVRQLLDDGANIDYCNLDGLTALHQAIIDGNMDMVEFLVENGANLQSCDNEGWTPLHAAVSCADVIIVKYLLEAGANIAAVNADGDIPSDLVRDLAEDEAEEMERILTDEMVRCNVKIEEVKSAEMEQMMRDAQSLMRDPRPREVKLRGFTQPETGATPIHVAASKGYLDVLRALVEVGFGVNDVDCDGWTPLHATAFWTQPDAAEILTANGADFTAANRAGQTPVDLAVAIKDEKMDQVLTELRRRQPELRRGSGAIVLRASPPPLKRRTSVSRMSVDIRPTKSKSDAAQEVALWQAAAASSGEESSEEESPPHEAALPKSEESAPPKSEELIPPKPVKSAPLKLEESEALARQREREDKLNNRLRSGGGGEGSDEPAPLAAGAGRRTSLGLVAPKNEESEIERRAIARKERQKRRSTQAISFNDSQVEEDPESEALTSAARDAAPTIAAPTIAAPPTSATSTAAPTSAKTPPQVSWSWSRVDDDEESPPPVAPTPSPRRVRIAADSRPSGVVFIGEPDPNSVKPCVNCSSIISKLVTENETLKGQLSELREANDARRATNEGQRDALENERLVRSGLETRLEELQTQVMAISVIESENTRLQEEKRALVRVISRLNKKTVEKNRIVENK